MKNIMCIIGCSPQWLPEYIFKSVTHEFLQPVRSAVLSVMTEVEKWSTPTLPGMASSPGVIC